MYTVINVIGPKARELLAELTDVSLKVADFPHMTGKVWVGYGHMLRNNIVCSLCLFWLVVWLIDTGVNMNGDSSLSSAVWMGLHADIGGGELWI